MAQFIKSLPKTVASSTRSNFEVNFSRRRAGSEQPACSRSLMYASVNYETIQGRSRSCDSTEDAHHVGVRDIDRWSQPYSFCRIRPRRAELCMMRYSLPVHVQAVKIGRMAWQERLQSGVSLHVHVPVSHSLTDSASARVKHRPQKLWS